MTNLYAAPVADLSSFQEPQEAKTSFLELGGRIGRVRWIAYTTGTLLLSAMAVFGMTALGASLGHIDSNLITFLPLINLFAFGAAMIVMSRRRLHDIGISPFVMVIALVPVINLYFFFLMVFKRGDHGANEYGPAPSPNNRLVYLSAMGLPIMWVVMFLIAIGSKP